MKVYIYYDANLKSIYAFTDNKNLAKTFERERNMKVFVKKVVEMTRDEFLQFELTRGRYCLAERFYQTRDTSTGIQKIRHVAIVGPEHEENTVFSKSMSVCDEAAKFYNPLIATLNDEYLKALAVLQYWDIMRMSNVISPYKPEEDILCEAPSDMEVDSFELFLLLYGHTFKD